MSDADMPFPCTHKGCKMTFTNEDHLNVHKKKHDMVLNLGLICKTAYADKTPTPTRFIRNCEEVGLFQDLQNVNPFEETFRKAVELTKSGGVYMPEPITDDTLHTPHILPHILQETQIKNQNIPDLDDTEFIMAEDVLEIDLKSSSSEDEVIIVDDEIPVEHDIVKTKKKTLKFKEKHPNFAKREATITKLKQALFKTKQTLNITSNNVSTINNELQTKGKSFFNIIANGQRKNMHVKNINPIDKKREINRAAQIRSRQKKKKINEQTERQLTVLRQEKDQLKIENQLLRNDLAKIKSILQRHDKCVYTNSDSIKAELQMNCISDNLYSNNTFNNNISICRPIQPKGRVMINSITLADPMTSQFAGYIIPYKPNT